MNQVKKFIWECTQQPLRCYAPKRKRHYCDETTITGCTGSYHFVKPMIGDAERCAPVTGEFPAQRPGTRSVDVFFDLCLNKRLSKQSWGWWFETPSRPLWRHCNAHDQGHVLFEIKYTQRAKMYLEDVLKTSLQDRSSRRVWRLKNDPSFWKRIFKVLKVNILDVLQPKFNAHLKTSIQVVLKTTTVGSSKRWYDG